MTKVTTYLCAMTMLLYLGSSAVVCVGEDQGWSAIEQKLKQVPSLDDVEHIKALPNLKQIYASSNPNLFWEMIGQTQYPLVRYVGFEFLQSSAAPSATEAGTGLILSSDFPESLAFKVVDLLAKDKRAAQMIETSLDVSARSHPNAPQRWSLLLSLIPPEGLENWYKQHLYSSMPMTYRALIVDEIYANVPHEDNLRKLMAGEIETYRTVPGIPRCVFALDADEAEKGYKEAVIAALTDPTVSVTGRLILATRKRTYILKNVDWNALKLPPSVLQELNQSDGK